MWTTRKQPHWSLAEAAAASGSKEISWSWICSTFPEHWSGCWIGWIGGGGCFWRKWYPATCPLPTPGQISVENLHFASRIFATTAKRMGGEEVTVIPGAPNKFRNLVALLTSSTSSGRSNPKGSRMEKCLLKGSNEPNMRGKGLVHPFVNAKMNNSNKNKK